MEVSVKKWLMDPTAGKLVASAVGVIVVIVHLIQPSVARQHGKARIVATGSTGKPCEPMEEKPNGQSKRSLS